MSANTSRARSFVDPGSPLALVGQALLDRLGLQQGLGVGRHSGRTTLVLVGDGVQALVPRCQPETRSPLRWLT